MSEMENIEREWGYVHLEPETHQMIDQIYGYMRARFHEHYFRKHIRNEQGPTTTSFRDKLPEAAQMSAFVVGVTMMASFGYIHLVDGLSSIPHP